MTTKPREFWIYLNTSTYTEVGGSVYLAGVEQSPLSVIEHSAYAALQKENEELQFSAIKEYTKLVAIYGDKLGDCRKLESEITSLRESLLIAVEALEFISRERKSDGFKNMRINVAYETLAKIKAKQGEL